MERIVAFRIYVDESGTHSEEWLVIGMLFVPDHGPLHSELCKEKENLGYFNNSPKRNARYRETHLSSFKSPNDVDVGKRFVKAFLRHSCFFRAVAVDWSVWKPKYFGTPFEREALLKRRAYKKWAEMLLQPELKNPVTGREIRNATLYLDRLRIMYGYDVLDHLRARFSGNYRGSSPYIQEYQHTDSWRDANQCLQLCDLLTGCVYQSLVPSTSVHKKGMATFLEQELKALKVGSMTPGFWRQFAPETLTRHHPKFSIWFWRPAKKRGKR